MDALESFQDRLEKLIRSCDQDPEPSVVSPDFFRDVILNLVDIYEYRFGIDRQRTASILKGVAADLQDDVKSQPWRGGAAPKAQGRRQKPTRKKAH
jgi:hypothetical protein